MTGTAFCSARALSGNVAAEPPRRVMKSRRLMGRALKPTSQPTTVDGGHVLRHGKNRRRSTSEKGQKRT